MSGSDSMRDATILVVDDHEENLRLLRRILAEGGFRNVTCTTRAAQTASLFAELDPDLVLLDVHMPDVDGFDVLAQLAPLSSLGSPVPVVMLTGDHSQEVTRRALSAGAKDFVAKPFDPAEALLRIRNLLETRFLHRELRHQNDTLEKRVQERTRALEAAQAEMLRRLAEAAEFRDDETGRHTERVAALAARIAELLGEPESVVDLLRSAASLHDVGKIGVPDAILLKPGALTPEERSVMQTHTKIGAQILGGGRSDLLRGAERIARSHHEWWDGAGYPDGLSGEGIPIEARIVAVSDVFDALTHDRPYRSAWPVPRVLEEIDRLSGRQFEPRVASALLSAIGSEVDRPSFAPLLSDPA